MNKVICAGVKTKVLMLSATPVNTKFLDLKHQLALAYEDNPENINPLLNTKASINTIFRQAQMAFNDWAKLEDKDKTTDQLLKMLHFDFFEVLDNVTIARSRKHIQKYYDTNQIGNFPERLKPISVRPKLTELDTNYNQIYEKLALLSLCIYTPSDYIFSTKINKYKNNNKGAGLTQQGRETGIRRLMSVNLLKRLESSVQSFKLTLDRIKKYIKSTLDTINEFEKSGKKDIEIMDINDSEFDADDANTDYFVGKKVRISLADMDYKTWQKGLVKDYEILEELTKMVAGITPTHDAKLQDLLRYLSQKIEHPINPDNKKVIVFTAFSDTAEYLYANVSTYIKDKYGLNTAVITGSIDGKTTLKKIRPNLNNVLTCFSPISKDKHALMPDEPGEIDILIATDCISEGQNLQDCDYLINYDIHWNPVRIIQRFGRIDRIGSKNKYIQLVNFWLDITLDEYIDLKSRVETRMKVSIMASTGDDNLISPEEKGDLEYRKQQLQRLQEEVVNVEDMSGGISIMDLGLNEFRLDLLEYVKHNNAIETKPKGLHAVVPATGELKKGVIFVLKNINSKVNINNKNRLHPFYLVYIGIDGDIICDYLNPKKLLDYMRLLCRGQSEPYTELCNAFNKETKDGKNMDEISALLSEAITSIIDVKADTDIDSLFTAGGTTTLMSEIKGIDDFELICFLVAK